MDSATLKQKAAEFAVTFVKSGMVLGLGEGSTAAFATRKIGKLYQSGELQDIHCIPCSENVKKLALSLGLPVSSLDDQPEIDLTIDGADEVDADMQLIKGGGGALLREKIVAQASKREIIIVDESKISRHLGESWHVPIEVIPFSVRPVMNTLAELGGRSKIRKQDDDSNYLTDEGNLIVDCMFGKIKEPEMLADKLNAIPGLVEHGLFIDLATDLIIASPSGIEHKTKETN